MPIDLFSDMNGEDLYAEIKMLREAGPEAVLLVEGSSDDKFFRTIVDLDRCFITISRGRERLLEVMGKVNSEDLGGVFGIIDRDFDEYLSFDYSACNIAYTDDHDLEMMMIKSPAFSKLILELGQERKIAEEKKRGIEVRTEILKFAYEIASVRLFSHLNACNYNFEKLRFKFVKNPWRLNRMEMLEEIFNHSRNWNTCKEVISDFIETMINCSHDLFKFCCGHDFCELLSLALRNYIGSQNANAVTRERIEVLLRCSYSFHDFSSTNLFSRFKEWEMRSPDFTILKQKTK